MFHFMIYSIFSQSLVVEYLIELEGPKQKFKYVLKILDSLFLEPSSRTAYDAAGLEFERL